MQIRANYEYCIAAFGSDGKTIALFYGSFKKCVKQLHKWEKENFFNEPYTVEIYESSFQRR